MKEEGNEGIRGRIKGHWITLYFRYMISGIHRASSSSWGESATARLCKIIVDSNKAFLQEVMDNKTGLLDISELEELNETDDLGISLPFLAVHYDRPDILCYLLKRGVDLSAPCDPMAHGNVMFYAGNCHIYYIFV